MKINYFRDKFLKLYQKNKIVIMEIHSWAQI